MNTATEFTLINHQNKALAFKVRHFYDDQYFKELNDFNFYTLILIKVGQGRIRSDLARYEFSSGHLISLPIYQPYVLEALGNVEGIVLQLHPDFFWNHKYQTELPCKTVLFKSSDEIPWLKIDHEEMEMLLDPLRQVQAELQCSHLGRYEIAVSWLTIFMINASRLKLGKNEFQSLSANEEPMILKHLIELIEVHYRSKHSPADYARLLNVTLKKLNRLAKVNLGKTMGCLISECLVTEAKRELYLTENSVKQIAHELGFQDVAYFSRFFKRRMKISPIVYRSTVKFENQAAS